MSLGTSKPNHSNKTVKTSVSYLDLHLEIDNGRRLKTKLYDKHTDCTFPIVNPPSSVAIL